MTGNYSARNRGMNDTKTHHYPTKHPHHHLARGVSRSPEHEGVDNS